jgi:hypothetical protein
MPTIDGVSRKLKTGSFGREMNIYLFDTAHLTLFATKIGGEWPFKPFRGSIYAQDTELATSILPRIMFYYV